MVVNESPKSYVLVPAYLLIVLIHVNQVGIGFLGFQRIIMKYAGQDAWISILLSAAACHLVIWAMVRTLQAYPSADLYGIHYDLYGKWAGMLFSLAFILYMLIAALVVLTNYVEMIQAWIFPEIPNWLLSGLILLLASYCLLAGFRTVAGFCFLCFLFTFWMIALLYYPLQYSNWNNLLPILEASPKQMVLGAKEMTLTIIGFEILYFVYPFLNPKQKVQKYAHAGILLTTLVYGSVMMTSILLMTKAEIMRTIWPTLNLYKIIRMPFFERFEILGVSITLWIIMPNIILFLWAVTRGMKRVFQWKQRYSVYIASGLIFITSVFLNTRLEINKLNDWLSTYAFYLIFIYPLFLYGYQRVVQQWRKPR